MYSKITYFYSPKKDKKITTDKECIYNKVLYDSQFKVDNI